MEIKDLRLAKVGGMWLVLFRFTDEDNTDYYYTDYYANDELVASFNWQEVET